MGMTPRATTVPRGPRQRGSVLLLALVVLLLMFLGAMFTLRGAFTDTGLTDLFSGRQKNILASDLALQWVANQIGSTGTSAPLEVSAQGKAWFRAVAAASAAAPSATYWSNCSSTPTSTQTCAQASLPTGTTQTAWVFVQPTGRTDASACNTEGLSAVYYDIWVHTLDARGQVAADTEALYKLCIR